MPFFHAGMQKGATTHDEIEGKTREEVTAAIEDACIQTYREAIGYNDKCKALSPASGGGPPKAEKPRLSKKISR